MTYLSHSSTCNVEKISGLWGIDFIKYLATFVLPTSSIYMCFRSSQLLVGDCKNGKEVRHEVVESFLNILVNVYVVHLCKNSNIVSKKN